MGNSYQLSVKLVYADNSPLSMIRRRAKCYGEAYNGQDEADQDQASGLMARMTEHVLRQWLSPVMPGGV